MKFRSTALLVVAFVLFHTSLAYGEPPPIVVIEETFEKWEDYTQIEDATVYKAMDIASETACIKDAKSRLPENGKIEFKYYSDFAPAEDGKFKVHVELFHEECGPSE